MSPPVRHLTKKFVTLRRFHKNKRDYNSDRIKEKDHNFFPSLLYEDDPLYVIGNDAIDWNVEIGPTDRSLKQLQHHLDIFLCVQQNMDQYLIHGFYSQENADQMYDDVCNIIALYLDYWSTMFIKYVYELSYYNICVRLFKELAPKACINDRTKQYMYWRCLVGFNKDLSIQTWNGRQIVWNLLRSRGSKLYHILTEILELLDKLDHEYEILYFDTTTHWRFNRLQQLQRSCSIVVITEEYLDRIDHYLEQNEINLGRALFPAYDKSNTKCVTKDPNYVCCMIL